MIEITPARFERRLAEELERLSPAIAAVRGGTNSEISKLGISFAFLRPRRQLLQ